MARLRIPTVAASAELSRFESRRRRLLARLEALGPPPPCGTARELVWQYDKVRLFRYGPPTGAPLLVVYALINRPDMLDLEPDRSLIRRLLELGLTVYLVDWGRPDAGDRYLSLDDYINHYLDGAVAAVAADQGGAAVPLLGVCQGGLFALCYSALHPQRVARLITMVTPLDFHAGAQPLIRMLGRLNLDALLELYGNLPGDWMRHLFLALQPVRLGQQKYLHLAAAEADDARLQTFLRMERWILDSPDLAGEAFREFAEQFVRRNQLMRGELRIGGRAVDPGRLRLPVLNIYGRRDHLVPPAAARGLRKLIRPEHYRELAFDGGHIGIYVSRSAQRQIPAAIADWVRA